MRLRPLPPASGPGRRRGRPLLATLLATVVVGALAAPAAADTADLTTDFEDGTTQGWQGNGVTAVNSTTAPARTGSGVLAVTDTTAGWGAVAHDLKPTIVAGTTYTLTAYVRNATGSGKVSMTVQEGNSFLNSGTYQVPMDDTGWTKLSRTYTLAADAATPDVLQVYFEAADDLSSFYVDDFTLTHTDATPGTGASLGNDFEDGGTGGWAPRGSVTLASSTEQSHGGARSLLTTGRTATWNGPALAVTGKVTAGKEHTVSVWARMASGTDTLRLTMEKKAEGVSDKMERLRGGEGVGLAKERIKKLAEELTGGKM